MLQGRFRSVAERGISVHGIFDVLLLLEGKMRRGRHWNYWIEVFDEANQPAFAESSDQRELHVVQPVRSYSAIRCVSPW